MAKISVVTTENIILQKHIWKNIIQKKIFPNYVLYLFILPALTYIIIFNYIPMYGVQIAFKEFSPGLGIWGSPWVGFEQFQRFFSSTRFWNLLNNTLGISIYQLIAGFPIPIILAFIMNYAKNESFKKFSQTVTYAPYFISMVVMVGMLLVFLSPRNGFVNELLNFIGIKSVFFMADPRLYKHIYVWSGIWQTAGYGSVIYMAALAGVSPEQHEAAIVDGASKLQRIWHIDIPGIIPTATILFILNVGQILSVGFEKAYLMQNSLNIGASEIISTYVYKIGLLSAQYSYATAIGLFNNIINLILLVSVNYFSKKISETSLW